MTTLLKAENLQIGFKRPLNATPWSFELAAGETIALVGPNGAGKTSLLLSLLGYLPLINGQITLGDSRPLQSLKPSEWPAWFSLLPQEQPFRAAQTVEEHLQLAFAPRLKIWESPTGEMQNEILDRLRRLGIESVRYRKLGELSSGERQRIFLARTLLQKSKITFLDEPTNHLDPGGTKRFWETLVAERTNGTTLISTHDLDFVRSGCSRVIALAHGQLVFNGMPDQFFCGKYSDSIFS